MASTLAFLFFFLNHPKNTVFKNVNLFFLQIGFSSDFAHKISFGKKNKIIKITKTKTPTYLPTLTFLGILQETKLFVFLGLTPLKFKIGLHNFYL